MRLLLARSELVGSRLRRSITILVAQQNRYTLGRASGTESFGVCDVIRKVVACLIRSGRSGPELLVFTHPNGSVQIPKGTLEDGESAEAAVLRELREESGISEAAIAARVVDLGDPARRPTTDTVPLRDQIWHIFRLRSSKPLPDSWQHRASGSPEEDGLVFSCRWIRLSRAKQHLHQLYHPVVDALLAQDSEAG